MTIKTPAKAGQTVYCIDHGEICEFYIEVIIIVISENCIKSEFIGTLDKKLDHICTDADFGKTVFVDKCKCCDKNYCTSNIELGIVNPSKTHFCIFDDFKYWTFDENRFNNDINCMEEKETK